MAVVKVADLLRVEEEARKLLEHRVGQIEGGRLSGEHWFAALITDAQHIQRRRGIWMARRGGFVASREWDVG